MTFDLIVNVLAALFSFFVLGILIGVFFSPPLRKILISFVPERIRKALSLTRHGANPIISPDRHPWQAEAVFNPAALLLNGRTHLLYRAIGTDGISRLGYASSADGVVFDDRLSYPAYVSQSPRLGPPGHRHYYSPSMYPSGGSWGGCEDPRMVLIDGRIYVTYQVFDGWDYIRIAVMSISAEDFFAKRFSNWSSPTLISPPNQIHKNWVVFPEKINGKFALIHSIAPKVEIAFANDLEAIGKTEPFIQSWVGPRGSLPHRTGVWDNVVRGSGPPPLKTEKGWLLFYHAIDDTEPGRYKIGAMLLDFTDPTKVLYRSKAPILEPNEYYENDGKPGIVYTCGATIHDGTIYVYYGGGDKVICVAKADLHTFLDALVSGEHAILESTSLQTQ